MGAVMTPVSVGELADKITILEIKAERLDDADKLAHVRTELDALLTPWRGVEAGDPGFAPLKAELKAVNATMWDIQDGLRDRERSQTFDDEFIRLARAVATTNHARVELKNAINRLAGAGFIEEKQYAADAD
ncbi:DUF6165 family protein [Luteimonas sp. TWI1416]|uniref:DUF6165 family protein n=1 Tax=unclassified Luteimonas TaxID=2629088 RepID=UPI00320949DC